MKLLLHESLCCSVINCVLMICAAYHFKLVKYILFADDKIFFYNNIKRLSDTVCSVLEYLLGLQ